MVIAELVRHSVAEEMHVYPVMRKHLPDGEQAVKHDTEEHKQIERTLKDLEGVDPSDARFTELVRSLQATLAEHISDVSHGAFLAGHAGGVRAQVTVCRTDPRVERHPGWRPAGLPASW